MLIALRRNALRVWERRVHHYVDRLPRGRGEFTVGPGHYPDVAAGLPADHLAKPSHVNQVGEIRRKLLKACPSRFPQIPL